MRKNPASHSGLFTPRILVAFALCSLGVLLGIFSLAATTPVEPTRANTSASDWSIVNSPNNRPTPTDNRPSGVTCVSASDCWAVGDYLNGAHQTLIERWDGTAWTIVASPNSSAIQNNFLTDVTCASTSECWAVGEYYIDTGTGNQTLIERWNGTLWSIVTSPNISGAQGNNYNQLTGVTCASASDCWAVGYYLTAGANGTWQTLIEHWDGTAWTIVTSPNNASQDNFLIGVTCVSVSQCWAVGYHTSGSAQTLIERWDGSSWTIVTSPNTLIAQDSYLSSVTCVSASQCWAVGYYNDHSALALADQTLIARWDGTAWALVTSANTALTQANRLSSATCVSASECWAVGYYNNGTADQTLIERWNGTSWAIVTSPNASAAQSNIFLGVACASASECWAIGFHFNGTVLQTLIERWDGTAWAIVTSPNNNAAQNNTLLSVTCVSSSDCWTVASYFNGSVQQTLIEHWDGTAWTITNSPNASTMQNNILYSVTCTTASDCWTVGYYFNSSNVHQTLTEHWNGSSWTIISSPDANAQNNDLDSMTCASSSDCWAVGYYNAGSVSTQLYQTLIEHWDGTSWIIVTSPNTSSTQHNFLNGVTCASGSECWAVGYYINGSGVVQTLIAHWNGGTWSLVTTSPNTSTTQHNYLHGVACASANECWAVGYYSNGSAFQTLIEQWNGTSWAIVTSPNASTTQTNFLNGVTCASGSECWAVGYYINNGGFDQTLTEHWDGTSWAIIFSPNTRTNTGAAQENFLNGVTCFSASECWAVGYYTNGGSVNQTLIEEYTLTIPSLTSVVSRMTHGSAGTFDINLPLTGTRGVECRSSVSLGAGNYTVVFTFLNNVTSCGTAGTVGGSVSSGPNLNQCTENLTGVIPPNPPGGEYLTVTLNNVRDSQNNTGNVSATMGVLVGDVNASGVVTSGDTNLCKAQALQPVTNANFRNDINASGSITTGDVNIIKQNALKQLPTPP